MAAVADPAPELASLAESPGWLALGHYHPLPGGGFAGEADDPHFFLSASGHHDPALELEATLAALREAGTPESRQRLACRYPARLDWIFRQPELYRQLPPGMSSHPVCSELEAWMNSIDPKGVTLVFPSAYLDSASSMFGHSFLRIDSRDPKSPPLLATTINFTADAEKARQDGDLFYAWKGLTGGYPGTFSILPYHAQVRAYTHMESRDLWEYPLTLDSRETRQLLRHVWEVRNVRFDYYFMDENCSYRTLALLDAARPSLQLRAAMPFWVLPVDAVRTVREKNLVSSVHWRPSSSTELYAHARQLNRDEQAQALALEDGSTPCCDENAARYPAKVLEVAYEALRYHTIPLTPVERKKTDQRALALLTARSRQAAGSQLTSPTQPEVSPDQGHLASRFSLGTGFQNGETFGEIEYRPLYHTLTDPAAGYPLGSAINFLDTTLRTYGHGDDQLEQLEVVGISSLNPVDRFIQPSSWQVRFGTRRINLNGQRPLLGYLEGDWGGAVSPAPDHLFYAMASASLLGGSALSSSIDPGLGPRAGWLYRHLLGGQGMFDFSYLCYLANPDACLGSLRFEHTLNLGHGNQSLRLRAGREGGIGSDGNLLSLSYQHYF